MKKLFLLCCLFLGLTAAYAQNAHMVTDPTDKAKALQKQLKLSDNQTAKVAAIYQESSRKFDQIKKENNGNTDKMMKSIGPLRAATIKKIKAVLTPRQETNYDVLIKDTNYNKGNGWSDGWSATASN